MEAVIVFDREFKGNRELIRVLQKLELNDLETELFTSLNNIEDEHRQTTTLQEFRDADYKLTEHITQQCLFYLSEVE